jgi:hypothetical protein
MSFSLALGPIGLGSLFSCGLAAPQALTGTATLRRLLVNMGDGSGFSIQILKFRMTENGHSEPIDNGCSNSRQERAWGTSGRMGKRREKRVAGCFPEGSSGRDLCFGGADGDRTRDLMTASHARSQLRYSPIGKTVSIAEGDQPRKAGAL